jgi:hypothetical protein
LPFLPIFFGKWPSKEINIVPDWIFPSNRKFYFNKVIFLVCKLLVRFYHIDRRDFLVKLNFLLLVIFFIPYLAFDVVFREKIAKVDTLVINKFFLVSNIFKLIKKL